jgi:hypothetical protein
MLITQYITVAISTAFYHTVLQPYGNNVTNKLDESEDLIVLMALWILTPCISWRARCFRGTYCLHLQGWLSLPHPSAGF